MAHFTVGCFGFIVAFALIVVALVKFPLLWILALLFIFLLSFAVSAGLSLGRKL